jgi:hypothetical protein
MRQLLAAAGIASVLIGGAVSANVQWWTPAQKDCPTFDSEQQCVAFCTQNKARCGDSTACASHTGPERPPC